MSIGSGSQSILRRKPITEMVEESGESHLSKSLGLWQLTAIGVGGIIGIGIFTSAGLVAKAAPTRRRSARRCSFPSSLPAWPAPRLHCRMQNSPA